NVEQEHEPECALLVESDRHGADERCTAPADAGSECDTLRKTHDDGITHSEFTVALLAALVLDEPERQPGHEQHDAGKAHCDVVAEHILEQYTDYADSNRRDDELHGVVGL